MGSFRGWIGEKKTSFHLWLSLKRNTYHRFHGLIIPSSNGTTQIDHLIISEYGIFIVETKNKKGWIFGSDRLPRWTQVIYRHKYSFQNPLRQTYRQKKVLAEFLNIDESKIYPVVYFVGNCSFKTPMPENVLRRGLGRYIKRYRNRIFTEDEVGRIKDSLRRHLSESTLTNKDHLHSLRKRHSSNSICPRCGSHLILRTTKKGPHADSTFLGCTAYPKCRFTKSA